MQGHLLEQGDHDPAVAVLKACLARALTPKPTLGTSPDFDARTEAAVVRFQAEQGTVADGIVGPVTWALLGRALGYAAPMMPPLGDAPPWVRNLLLNNPRATSVRGLDVAGALQLYERSYGALTVKQRQGLSSLLEQLRDDPDVADVRWAAYMLATVKHECADRWQPIDEFGRGAGREYGKPVKLTDPQGRQHAHVYYGRGYVQLTWHYNYKNLGQQLGLGDALLYDPPRVLDPAIAYRILSHGMRKGSFTGVGLAKYIKGDRCDYKNARKIINGLDAWERIQRHAMKIETILLASVPAQHALPLTAAGAPAQP